MKKFISVCLCAFVALFSGCSDPARTEFDELVKAVPPSSAAFASMFVPKSYPQKILAAPGCDKALDALKNNPVLNEKLRLAIEQFSKESPLVAEAFSNKEKPMEDVVAFLSKTEACGVVAFTDSFPIVGEKISIPWTVALSGRLVGITKTYLKYFPEEDKISVDGRTFFRVKLGENAHAEETEFFIADSGNYITIASSTERVVEFENAVKNPMKRCILDDPAFRRLQKGYENADFSAFVNFDRISGLRELNPDGEFKKMLAKHSEGFGYFASVCKYPGRGEGVARLSFNQPIYLLDFVKSATMRKLDTLKNSLPGSEYAIGLCVPAPTTETFINARTLREKEVPAEAVELLKKLDLQTVYFSVFDCMKFKTLFSGESLPEMFAKIDCGNSDALKDAEENLSEVPFIQKSKIGETEVFSLNGMLNFARLGKKTIYASSCSDSAAALDLANGRGKSLADEKTFSSIAKKLGRGNVFEIFIDSKRLNEGYADLLCEVIKESPLFADDSADDENAALPEGFSRKDCVESYAQFLQRLYAATKKNAVGAALKLDDEDKTMLSLVFAMESEYDFAVLAEKISEIK